MNFNLTLIKLLKLNPLSNRRFRMKKKVVFIPKQHQKLRSPIIKIQCLIRSYLAKIKYKIKKKEYYNNMYDKNFANKVTLKFISNGSALKIQRWYRSLRHVRKKSWLKKYHKYINKLKHQKLLINAMHKSIGYHHNIKYNDIFNNNNYISTTNHDSSNKNKNSGNNRSSKLSNNGNGKSSRSSSSFSNNNNQDNYTKNEKMRLFCAIIITRLIRGYLGRRKIKKIKDKINQQYLVNIHSILKIQSHVRGYLTRKIYSIYGSKNKILVHKMRRYKKLQLQLQFDRDKYNSFDMIYSKQYSLDKNNNIDGSVDNISSSNKRRGSDINSYNRSNSKQFKFGSIRGSYINTASDVDRNDDDNDDNTNINDINTSAHSNNNEENEINTTKYSLNDIPLQFLIRRQTFLFLTLKFGDVNYIHQLHHSIIKIQCRYRQYQAKLLLLNKVNKKKQFYEEKVQKFIYKLIYQKRIAKALQVIQTFWKRKLILFKLKTISCIKIQSLYRSRKQKIKYQYFIKFKQYSVIKIQSFLLQKIKLKKIKIEIKRLRYLVELKACGEYLYQLTKTRIYTTLLWKNIKKTNISLPHELQKLFLLYSINGGIDCMKVIKLFRECKNLIDDIDMTVNTIEMQFTRLKDSGEKRINYNVFLDLILSLAVIKFLKIDPAKVKDYIEDATVTSSTSTSTTTKANNNNNNKSTSSSITTTVSTKTNSEDTNMIPSFYYSGLYGKKAFIMKFIITFITTNSDYQKCEDNLKSKKISTKILSHTLVIDSIQAIQKFIKNRKYIKMITRYLYEMKQMKIKNYRNHAGTIINSSIKGFLSRRLIKRLAQRIYCKYIDGDSELEYWNNPRTGKSFWTKPKLLGEYDCGMATRMPRKEEVYVIKCSDCNNNNSTCYCIQCKLSFCTLCYAMNHKSKNKLKHQHLLIDNCIQCEFQIGTFYCEKCKDNFCDSCYRYVHKRGRLRFHVYQRLSDVCDKCQYRTAHWKENFNYPNEENNYRLTSLWCNDCYYNTNSIMPIDVFNSNSYVSQSSLPSSLVKISFYGRSVKEHHEKLLIEDKKLLILEAFQQRKIEIQKRKEINSILCIQRVYRGYVVRKLIKNFIENRKIFFELRKKEEHIRNSMLYYISSIFGYAPSLKSDTPLEKVLKSYPTYMHHILELCVQGKWSDACRMQIEHENHMNNIAPRNNMIQRMIIRLSINSNEKRFKKIQDQIQVITVQYEKAAQKYRTVTIVTTIRIIFTFVIVTTIF